MSYGREPPVEVRRAAQRRHRLGRAAREPAAPQPRRVRCSCRSALLPVDVRDELDRIRAHRSSRRPGPALRGDLLTAGPTAHEALGQRLVEGVALVVGGEVEVVERLARCAAR